jgi:WD40 repeat protein
MAIHGVGIVHQMVISDARDYCNETHRYNSMAFFCRGHNYPIWCVDVSTLGVYVATGSHDRTARLWSLDRTFPLRIFAGHNEDVEVAYDEQPWWVPNTKFVCMNLIWIPCCQAVQFHPNSSYLATGSADKTVRLWAVNDAKLVRVLPGHKGGVQALSFSPNGKYIASAGKSCIQIQLLSLIHNVQIALYTSSPLFSSIETTILEQWVLQVMFPFACSSIVLVFTVLHSAQLHADGNITCNTHWAIQCSRMLKYSITILEVLFSVRLVEVHQEEHTASIFRSEE